MMEKKIHRGLKPNNIFITKDGIYNLGIYYYKYCYIYYIYYTIYFIYNFLLGDYNTARIINESGNITQAY
jgi:serine/threonine protein kinase